MSVRVAFRVDASSRIGTGHFMRCLTLAGALRTNGAEVRFVCRELPDHLAAMLVDKGIALAPLTGAPSVPLHNDLPHSSWLWTDQLHDAEASLSVMSGVAWDWLVVDHYALDHRWESRMRSAARKIMVIDDLADRRHDCDLLLDQNYYRDSQTRYDGKVPRGCRLLVGPRYAVLRDEFRQLRSHVRPRTGEVKRILVFFGGVDADNYTGRTIEALRQLGLNRVDVDVIIGILHPCRTQIEQACAAAGYVCHVQTPHMAQLLAAADLAIGAGGTATWERCCLGVPALCFCQAANQRQLVDDAADAALIYAPLCGVSLQDGVRRHVAALIENTSLRRLISRTAMEAVDGNGAQRITRILNAGEIDMRPADEGDALSMFEWRNHPAIRKVSRNQEPIAWETHQAWFAKTLMNQDRVLLIGSVRDNPIGVVRFDQQGNEAEVSLYLVPDRGLAGHGYDLLISAERWVALHRSEIERLRANVLVGNEGSQQLFLHAGYLPESINYSKELRS